ncbi:GntP family gluconate:H+ symporter [Nocardioides ginsengisegetis]|uniref:GntP family gluconate:H+ symporter n=1 Tax=Nocardioides ginsengisegetis TaxID=661491 RepID=A0A7W3J1S3_9ACTN|nr:gluconate:H+ symporter [Nocardioides ginsengisegetis]MBA8804730.1 GntP family gluconate:H+ symporter [Nocardioides ginsengisegetis]
MSALSAVLPLAAAPLVEPVASGAQLITAALVAIALIVVLITVAKVHPFLALTFGAITVGALAGQNVLPDADGLGVLTSFGSGFGATASGVGILIGLGAMFAKLLADSGGADQIVDTIVGHASPRTLPWAMALVGAIIGLPMFFEIGLVLLMPVIYLVARRAQVSLITVGIPALAGLSAMHGLVPPHPGPLTAIGYLGADLGVTLAMGVLVAIPTVIVSGPLFGRIAGRWVDVPAPHTFDADREADAQRPSFAVTMFSVLLPVVLMLGKALVDIFIDDSTQTFRQVFDLLGTPLVALLIAVVVAMFTLGRGAGMDRARVSKTLEGSLPAIAGIILIVAAGGGFKQVLVDTGIGTLLADWAADKNISVLLLAWVLAVLIRLATGSATVATITASSLMIGLVDGLSTGETSLVVLAVGAGSVFFSHVNDAGFWLVKEYFGLSVGQTLKTWSLMETILSVTGLVFVLLLGIVV